jgi:hypothetical protein
MRTNAQPSPVKTLGVKKNNSQKNEVRQWKTKNGR